MNQLTIESISPMSVIEQDRVQDLAEYLLTLPQVPIPTDHLIHAGMYARTIMIPAGVTVTGALIKIATIVVMYGEASFYISGEEMQTFSGYKVLPASQGRKQVVSAIKDTYVTMLFPTDFSTVDEAENQFTDEVEDLASNKHPNIINITGLICQDMSQPL